MKKEIISNKIPKAIGPYSQGILVGNFVFTSGQIHLTPDGNLLEGTIEEQTRQVMENLQLILEAANVTFDDVVKTTMYITDFANFGRINKIYQQYFSKPYPARETVSVKELPKGSRIEISMIAIK